MGLLERDEELAILTSALDGAASSRGRVALVRGEAGIGKTALVQEFLDRVGATAHILVGACDDLLTKRPFGPVHDMARAEPSLREALGTGQRSPVHDALIELSARSLRPTVTVVEDAHWADEATLDAIRHLGRRIDRTHGLLIVTYRDESLSPDHPLRYIIGDLPPHGVIRLSLAPLSEDAIRSIAGVRAARIAAESGGNPFFVTELLSNPDGLPRSIVDSIRSRVGRLSPGAVELAEIVSLIPGRTELRLLESRKGLTGELDEAERHGLLTIDPRSVQYRHELARQAVESSIPSGRRRALHERILAALLELDADPARIVHHAVAAGDHDVLLDRGPSVARAALDVASFHEAYRFYRHLEPVYIRLPESERAQLLHDWSFAAETRHQLAEAIQRADEAVRIWRATGDVVGLATGLRRRSRAAWLAGDRDEAEACAAEAVAVLEPLGESADLSFAYSAVSQLAMLARDVDRATSMADKAIQLAERFDRREIVAHALINKGTAASMGRFPDQASILREGIELARDVNAYYEVGRGWLNLAWLACDVRRLEDAIDLAERAQQVTEDMELHPEHLYATTIKAHALALKGNWFDAEDLARPILATPSTWTVNKIAAGTVLSMLHIRRGHPDADITLSEAETMARPTREVQRTGPLAALRAEHGWVFGDIASIGDAIEEHLPRLRELGDRWTAGDLVFWAWQAGVDVSPLADTPEPYQLIFEGDWQGAAAAFGSLDMPYERAMMLTHGEDRAVIEAISVFDSLGAVPAANRFRAELRARGVTGVPTAPTSDTRSYRASGLTTRQMEVLELLTRDLTNPEIADRLFISPRTVDHHVSAILTKLDVRSRTDAVGAAIDRGLFEATRDQHT